MRTIGTIPQQLDAERFSDYLLAQGMPNMVEESGAGGEWLVWVEDDDHLDRAKAELEQYRANPSDPRYNGASKKAEDIRAAKEKKQKRLAKNYVDVRTNWGSARQWAVPVTLALMIISCGVALATQLGRDYSPVGDWLAIATVTPEQAAMVRAQAVEMGMDPDEVRANPALIRGLPQVLRGQVWRLVTPIFLHFGILHLVFNLFWLRDLGGMIETRRGSLRLLALVLVTATISNLVQYYWSEQNPYFGGMSGVVYGLLGYVWMKMKFEPHLGLGIGSQGLLIMMVWLVVCAVGLIPNVANAAHVAGLAVGVAAGYAPTAWRRVKRSLGR